MGSRKHKNAYGQHQPTIYSRPGWIRLKSALNGCEVVLNEVNPAAVNGV
jgi:hypothetical protein